MSILAQVTLPGEYQIDEHTARRMEREIGAPLPDGAVEALYEFEQQRAEFVAMIRRRGEWSAEFTWLRAMMFAHLGPLKYVEYWRDQIVEEMRDLTRLVNRKRQDPPV